MRMRARPSIEDLIGGVGEHDRHQQIGESHHQFCRHDYPSALQPIGMRARIEPALAWEAKALRERMNGAWTFAPSVPS
jgi:hypothetical protein